MKILYLAQPIEQIEYLDNTVFHGLKTIFGQDMYENTQSNVMYSDSTIDMKGRFTLYKTLDRSLQNLIAEDEIVQKITDKFFDLIIYGSVFRITPYLDLVLQTYDRDRIVFINGEDEHDRINGDLVDKGWYFKREIPDRPDYYNVFPLSFGIPAVKILTGPVLEKTKDMATVIPGDKSTYVFTNEEDYYNDYRKSKVAFTYKKGGWDCLRHYEILANGCLPLFPDLDKCPTKTMTTFPKKLILLANNVYLKNGMTREVYYKTVEELLQYTRDNLTTEAVAYMMLKTVLR